MRINTVPASRGLDWITEGFGLFRLNPLIWIVIVAIFLILLAFLPFIPLVGGIASVLLQPVLLGGMLLGCRDLAQGRELRIEHLLDGFQQNTNALATVGLLSGLAYLLVGAAALLATGGAAVGLGVLGGLANQPDLAAGGAILGYLMSGLIGVTLSAPIVMATWFAPALVVFANLSALDALKASFTACVRNMLPFLLYGIILMLLAVVAAIPFGLGLLVLAPVVVASVYTSYRDIFI